MKKYQKYHYCGDCVGHCSCYEVSYVVMIGKVDNQLDFYPCEFLDWLQSLGDVTRIVHNISEFYEDYTFFVGPYEIAALLPHWVTDTMLSFVFDCSVVLLYGGGYNG